MGLNYATASFLTCLHKLILLKTNAQTNTFTTLFLA